jgi:hypothetical protein
MNPEGSIMRSLARFVLVASFLTGVAGGLSAVQAAEPNVAYGQDQWRYTFHNGEWWYWLPANRWVYWRDNQWNDYNPQTFKSRCSTGAIPTTRSRSSSDNRAATDSDIRPFYGHAQSNLDRRPLEENSEVGPFYGHVLPSEVFGDWRERRSIRPFYGHAVSSYDY